MTEVRVPEIGENIESGDIIKLLVAEGDAVEVDQPLAELETDKAVLDIPCPVKGTVEKILVAAGDTIKIGQVIMHVASAEEVETGDTEPESAQADKQSAEPTTRTETQAEPQPDPAADRAPARSNAQQAKDADDSAKTETGSARVPAAPAVRRLARELGVDLTTVPGSGTRGRISADDVKGHVRHVMSGAVAAPSGAAAPAELPDFSRWGEVSREPLSKVRRITADSMTTSWTTIPHVTQHDRADITNLEAFRKRTSPQVETHGAKLTVTAILLKVCATALKVFPGFNSSLDVAAQELVVKKYYHIGVAVDTDRGLLVPVVRDADTKTLTQLAVELNDLAARTRDKKVKPDELEGGTFTISNLGGIGGTAFTPIVYAPQVAILGVARTQKEVRMVDGQPQERLFLPLSLSYDHRVIDGADGARFLRWIAEALENPYLAVLGA